MSEPAPIILQGLNIEAFERLVHLRDGSPESYEAILRELLGALMKVRQGSGFFGVPESQLTMLYSRLASAITAIFADPKFGLSPDGFAQVMAQHSMLHAIFRASAFETMDHVLSCLGTRNPEHQDQMDFQGDYAIGKMLICWSLDSEVDVNFEAVAQAFPGFAAMAIIGMLSIGGTHSERSYARRLMLMRMRGLVASQPLHPAMMSCAGDAYMHCSYTDSPDKHEIKRVINGRMRAMLEGAIGLKDSERRLARKERPTIVIPIEWFGSYHAMFRCYAPSIRQLRERFRLVGIYREKEIDAEGIAVFDKGVPIPADNVSIHQVLEAIIREEPDIIYYPSLGMAAWYVALSAFRLAPIQVITPGHPATSLSPCIDYIVSDADLFGDERQYSERCIGLPVGAARYIGRHGVTTPERHAPMSDARPMRFAIPAMATKLIPPFLAALKRISERAARPVEFHFFPNMVGMSHDLITKDVRRWIPGAVVHMRADYQTYLNNLAQCDVMLSTFPFGATNSAIDAFLCRIPVVTLEGDQIHSKSDASMLRRLGVPGTIAKSVDEYVDIALALVKVNLSVLMPTTEEVEREFFGDAPPGAEGAFLKAFETMYEEALKKEGQ